MSNIRFSAESGEDSKYAMCIKCALHSGQYLTLLQCYELNIGTELILCKTAALPRFLLENTCRRHSSEIWYIIVHCVLKIIVFVYKTTLPESANRVWFCMTTFST